MRTLTGASVEDVNEAFRAARELLESGAMAVTRKGAQDSLPTRDEIEHLLILGFGICRLISAQFCSKYQITSYKIKHL